MNSIIVWKPLLEVLAGSLLLIWICIVMGLLFRRIYRSEGMKTALLVLAPKMGVALLLYFAFFDPVMSILSPNGTRHRIIVLLDQSESMLVRDDAAGTRKQRAEALFSKMEKRLSSRFDMETLPFDAGLAENNGNGKSGGSDPAGSSAKRTDIGTTLLQLSERPGIEEADAILILTDGGDDPVRPAILPRVPHHIIGVGRDASEVDDLLIRNVEFPPQADIHGVIPVQVEIEVNQVKDRGWDMKQLQVELQEQTDKGWTSRAKETIDVSSLSAVKSFEVAAGDEERSRNFRVVLPNMEGELTKLNNVQTFSVEVRDRSVHVLMISRYLGWEENKIRSVLGKDPAISLTAMTRASDNRFVLHGDRREGDDKLKAGISGDPKDLEPYRVIILGSFPASEMSEEQQAALASYVERGGSLVLLGGEDSFGLGGYDKGSLSALLPWNVGTSGEELKTGFFPVRLSLLAEAQPIWNPVKEQMERMQKLSVYSVNTLGSLKMASLSILESRVGEKNVSLAAILPYGEGLVMGIASNTLWRWQQAGGNERELYTTFWAQSVRYLTGDYDGGRYISVNWDSDAYQPNSKAQVGIRVAGQSSWGQLRVEARMIKDGQDQLLDTQRVGGYPNAFRCNAIFREAGDYTFVVKASVGDKELETYSKKLSVKIHHVEGSVLEVPHVELEAVAARTGGQYYQEKEAMNFAEHLDREFVSQSVTKEIPLIQIYGIYFILILMLLVLEWMIRKKKSLI
ncbi:MAG: hypothetical protein V4727_03360 [Verrucomicrobiota bacterium]